MKPVTIHYLVKGRLQKKKHCIFYDIWQKGRGSKDQNQISEKNLNLDKVLRGVGKRLQCHKNSYLKNLFFFALKQHFFVKRHQFSILPSPVYDISIFALTIDNSLGKSLSK